MAKQTAIFLLQIASTANMRVAILLLSVLIAGGVASRQLASLDNEDAIEHQRILAELEELHRLRERMLQEGAIF